MTYRAPVACSLTLMSVWRAYWLAATCTVNPAVDTTEPLAGATMTGAGEGAGVLLVVTTTLLVNMPKAVLVLTLIT